MSVFKDQKLFMDVTGQKPSVENSDLYMKLIWEEYEETLEAYNAMDGSPESKAEVIDGAIDLIYVATGLIHAMGFDPQPFWDEVQASNMSKFDRLPDGSYVVQRRGDGKILKGPNYFPPNLLKIVNEQSGAGG